MAGNGTASVGEAMRGWTMRSATTAALLISMLTLGACGTWADPTKYFGSDEDDAPPPATAVANSPTSGSSDRFPNLARVPPRPVEVTPSGERRQALDNLAADRNNARYTDEELRARPADSNTPPPAPRPPVTSLPAAAPARPADVAPQQTVQAPAQPQSPAQPQAAAQAPVQAAPVQAAPVQATPAQPVPQPSAPASASVADTYSQSLSQSAATTLPPGLVQPGQASVGTGYSSNLQLPGSQQLLAIVRFNGNESALGRDDRDLIRKTAEYFKGVGGKGALRVVSYAPNPGLSQRRAELVSAELRRHGIAFSQIRQDSQGATAAPAYYETAARATDQNRRVEIYIVN